MTDNRNYGVPDEIAEKLIRRGWDLGYSARKGEEATNAQWLADKQRATADPWAQHGPGWCPPEAPCSAAHSADSVASNCERGECPTCGPDDREEALGETLAQQAWDDADASSEGEGL